MGAADRRSTPSILSYSQNSQFEVCMKVRGEKEGHTQKRTRNLARPLPALHSCYNGESGVPTDDREMESLDR